MRYVPGHVIRHLVIGPEELVQLPEGALLTGEGWRLKDGSLSISVSVPKDAPDVVVK